MKRAKVCHLIHDGSGGGGGATFSLAYFPPYNEVFDTFAITGNDGNLAERLRARGVRTFTLSMARPLRCLLSWPALWNIFRREKPDAVVVHGQWGGFFGSVAARWAGVPVVIYYTQFPSFYSDWDLVRIIRNRLAESVTCRHSTKVVALSSAGRYQYLIRHLTTEDKILHIPNGLDPSALGQILDPAELRREMSPSPAAGDPVVVSVSRLADQKRIDWLVRAWALVESRFPTAHLAIVGSGPEEKRLHALARDLKLERCHFLGLRPNGYRYFQASDFGVICSMFEGQPLALIEAMFLGCAMVGTEVDGIGETILNGETGLVVPPGDPEALAAAIVTLLSDPARTRAMGEAARQRAHELYSLHDVLARQIKLVEVELQRAKAKL